MGYDVYLSDTARNRTHSLLCLECAPISQGRRLGPVWVCENALSRNCYYFNCKTLQEATRLQEKLDWKKKTRKNNKISSNLHVGSQNFLTTIRRIIKYQTKMQQQGNKYCQRKKNNWRKKNSQRRKNC